MHLMTPSLIRAARGLLNWQQRDLATAANLALSVVNKFERAVGKTRAKSVQAMIAALTEAGVEFMPNSAIRLAQTESSLQRFTGSDFIDKMNADIYATIRKPGQIIYTCSTDENHWFAPNVKKTNFEYYAWREKMQVKEYFLTAEGNTVFESPRQHYRFLPAAMIGKISYVLYADRFAFISWRSQEVYLLTGKHLVEPFREQFKFLWRLGRKA